MVRKYTLKTVIYIIVVFKFYYWYLTHPFELVTVSIGKHFHSSEAKNDVLMWSTTLYTQCCGSPCFLRWSLITDYFTWIVE